jgi:stage II sporulation protein Q
VKQLNKISKEKAQRILFIAVLIIVFGIFFISLALLKPAETPPEEKPDPPIIENPDPVEQFETFVKPYTNTEVQIIRKFWSVDKSIDDQLASIIVYGSSYYNSKGVSYANQDQEFDVIASLSGTVKKVTESAINGKVILLDHGDGIETEYMSLSEVNVAEGDEVTQGEVIGKSGFRENDVSAGNHLHFKIIVNGKEYDPEIMIGKAVNEIN